MIEKTVLVFLSARLPVPVLAEIPTSPPETFVLIEKTGSGRSNHIQSATFAVQSYAPSLLQAAELNEQAKTAMDELPDLDTVCRAALNSDYNYTDTTEKRYRYQAVYDITHYEA